MESAVLSPAPGQTVVAIEEGRHGNGNEIWRSESRTTQREILAGVAAGAKDAAVGFKDGLVTAYQVEGRQAVAAEKHAGDASVQAEKLAAAGILQAEKLASAAALAAQECCCELKELIRADGEKTRDLISANTLQDQRDRAAKAEQAYMALFTSKVPPVTPTP